MTDTPDPFTDEELEAAAAVPVTDEILLHAGRVSTQVLSDFGRRIIEPVFATQLALSDRDNAVGMTFYRLLSAVHTLSDLRQPHHFQAISAQTRLVLELCIDIELLHEGKIARSIERFHGFTRAARFKLASDTVKFYDAHPALERPGDAEERRALANTPGAREEVEALCRDLWGRPKSPQHWSGLRWSEQVELVRPELQRWYASWAPLHAWLVHAGGAGVGGLPARSFIAIELMCRETVRAVVPEAYRQVAVEMHMHRAIPNFFELLDRVQDLAHTCAAIDAQLQSLGRPSKLTSQ